MDGSEPKCGSQDASPADDTRYIDADTEEALQALVREGLPEVSSLRLGAPRLAGAETPEIESISVRPEGTLYLQGRIPNELALVSDPNRWSSTLFVSEVVGHGPLTIEQGASHADGCTIGSSVNLRCTLYGWRWSAVDPSCQTSLWAAPVKFYDAEPPVLARRHGNMLLAIGDRPVRGWRFKGTSGPAFLVPNGNLWYLALNSSGKLADFDGIALLCTAIGFVLGAPFEVGVFQRVGKQGAAPGLAHLGLRLGALAQESQQPQPAAVPFDCHPSWTAKFIDLIIALAANVHDAPIVRSINLHFASSVGFIETQFLHSWMALEVLARWGIESDRVPDGGELRLADKQMWLNWVKAHEAGIKTLAAPGMAPKLLSRVKGAETDRPTKVQRAFRGLGIEWTSEMDDAEKVRHGVVHEGAISGGPIEILRDRVRIGLVNTMLTTLLAHLVGYRGPVADRSKTCLSPTDPSKPSWWNQSELLTSVEYRGRGVDATIE